MDFERIRKVDGYVYYWKLSDLPKLDRFGHLSYKNYKQGDCKLFRHKSLSVFFHKEPMGEGTGETSQPKGENANWRYPPLNSMSEVNLNLVCVR